VEADMNESSFIAMMDNGGRRLWTDRRKRTVPIAMPDRRSGCDRRTGLDRRGFKETAIDSQEERRRWFRKIFDRFQRHV
jgi:hypothetical protein